MTDEKQKDEKKREYKSIATYSKSQLFTTAFERK